DRAEHRVLAGLVDELLEAPGLERLAELGRAGARAGAGDDRRRPAAALSGERVEEGDEVGDRRLARPLRVALVALDREVVVRARAAVLVRKDHEGEERVLAQEALVDGALERHPAGLERHLDAGPAGPDLGHAGEGGGHIAVGPLEPGAA